jgi:hypothetical protein
MNIRIKEVHRITNNAFGKYVEPTSNGAQFGTLAR